MKKGIHPKITNVTYISSINNVLQIRSIFPIKKYRLEIDPYSHIIFNKQLGIKTLNIEQQVSSKKNIFNYLKMKK